MTDAADPVSEAADALDGALRALRSARPSHDRAALDAASAAAPAQGSREATALGLVAEGHLSGGDFSGLFSTADRAAEAGRRCLANARRLGSSRGTDRSLIAEGLLACAARVRDVTGALPGLTERQELYGDPTAEGLAEGAFLEYHLRGCADDGAGPMLEVPADVRAEMARGLRLRESSECGARAPTAAMARAARHAIARARSVSEGARLPASAVRNMKSYFEGVGALGPQFAEDHAAPMGAAEVAFALNGGEPGQRWAQQVLAPRPDPTPEKRRARLESAAGVTAAFMAALSPSRGAGAAIGESAKLKAIGVQWGDRLVSSPDVIRARAARMDHGELADVMREAHRQAVHVRNHPALTSGERETRRRNLAKSTEHLRARAHELRAQRAQPAAEDAPLFEIDDEVFEALQEKASPSGQHVNSTAKWLAVGAEERIAKLRAQSAGVKDFREKVLVRAKIQNEIDRLVDARHNWGAVKRSVEAAKEWFMAKLGRSPEAALHARLAHALGQLDQMKHNVNQKFTAEERETISSVGAAARRVRDAVANAEDGE